MICVNLFTWLPPWAKAMEAPGLWVEAVKLSTKQELITNEYLNSLMNDVRDSPSRGSAGSLLEGDGHLYTNGLHCTGVLSNLNQYRKVSQAQGMSQFPAKIVSKLSRNWIFCGKNMSALAQIHGYVTVRAEPWQRWDSVPWTRVYHVTLYHDWIYPKPRS